MMENVTLETVAVDIGYIKEDVAEIKAKTSQLEAHLNSTYITKQEFEDYKKLIETDLKPIRLIVYGLVTLILTAVIVAMISLVVAKGGA